MNEAYFDLTGRQIYAGDLLRTFHFRGPRRKRYWLYHGVRKRADGYLEMVPVSELCTGIKNGGCVPLKGMATDGIIQSEIIAGYGPNGMSHVDRKRRPPHSGH